MKPDRLAHGDRLDLDGLAVRLRVNPRARRISLRLDPRRAEAVATAPSPARLRAALEFARSRRAWIAERLAARPAPAPLGARLSLFGRPVPLIADGRRPRIDWSAEGLPDTLSGCGLGVADRQLVARAVRAAALTVFVRRAEWHCARLGVEAPTIKLFDARSRWGSCTPARGDRGAVVRLSWRLALASFAVADYVVAHECAHLKEANHGPRFWKLVGDLVGDPSAPRAELRAHGAALHGF
jgi:predicted metal-dependent hydrolase